MNQNQTLDIEAGKEAVRKLEAPFAFMTKGECHLINPGKYKLKEMIEEQKYVMSLIEKDSVEYLPDEEVGEAISGGKSYFFRKTYTKEEIIKAAREHSPFPPKSTRHLIPGRIVRLNMRLGWLHRSPEDATMELKRMLSQRVYQGNVRKYYEPVTVIY